MFSYPTEFYGEDILHTQVWERSTAEALGEIWGLDAGTVKRIKNHPYGVPRGRVSIGVGMVFINHGKDTPMDKDEILRKVSSEFGLGGLVARDKVKVAFDHHEMMQKEDRNVINGVLGMNPILEARRKL